MSDCGLVDSNALSIAVAEEIKRLCKKKNSSFEFVSINNPDRGSFDRVEWVVKKKDGISVSDFLFSISRTEDGNMGTCKIFFYAKKTLEPPNNWKEELYMKNYTIYVYKYRVTCGNIHKGLVNGISIFLFIINLIDSWQKNNPGSVIVTKNVGLYCTHLLNILSEEARKLTLPDEIFQKQITISLFNSQISFWMGQGVEFILRFNQDTWGFDFIISKSSDESPLKKIILEEDLNVHPGPNLLDNIDETMSNRLLRTIEEKFLKYYV